MRQAIRDLYFGKTRTAKIFRYGLLVFDVATIIFFVVSSMLDDTALVYTVDVIIAIFLMIDLGLRLWISERPKALALEFTTWLDIVVIVSLLLRAVHFGVVVPEDHAGAPVAAQLPRAARSAR